MKKGTSGGTKTNCKLWIEAVNVEVGINQYGIMWLVMGAAAEKLYSKDMSELMSNKPMYVWQNAPLTCQIWFACKGQLIYTRKPQNRKHLKSE